MILCQLLLNDISFIFSPPLLYIPRDGNFAPPLLASSRAGFPRLVKVMGRRWGEILDPHHGAGRGWVYTF